MNNPRESKPLTPHEYELIQTAEMVPWDDRLRDALRRAVENRGIATSTYDTVDMLVSELEGSAR